MLLERAEDQQARLYALHLRAAPAALLGFAAWLSGNGALAWCAVECAQEAEPGYTLAGLLSEALAGAVPPSAWRPLPREQVVFIRSKRWVLGDSRVQTCFYDMVSPHYEWHINEKGVRRVKATKEYPVRLHPLMTARITDLITV